MAITFGAQLTQGQKTIREHVLEVDLTPAERDHLRQFNRSGSRNADWSHVQIRATNTPDRKRDALTVWDRTGVYGIHAGGVQQRAFLRELVSCLEIDDTVKQETLQAIDYYA